MEQDKYADALEQYHEALELEPGTSENYLRLAQLYRRLGQFDKRNRAWTARNSSRLGASKFFSTKRCSMRIRDITTTR